MMMMMMMMMIIITIIIIIIIIRMNEIVACALSAVQIPNTKEPQGLCESDGKCPDGKSFVWDATVVCPLANSYVASAVRDQ